MAHKVSFDELKALVSITDVAAWIGLKLTGTTYRGDCPLCAEERSFTITPSKGLFGWFKCQKRGSILDLVHFVRETANVRDAALLIQQHFLWEGTVPVREDSPAPVGNSIHVITRSKQNDGDELKPLDYLEVDHPQRGNARYHMSIPNTKRRAFTRWEVKSKTGSRSPGQKVFEQNVRTAGAEYYIVRSVDDVVTLGLWYTNHMKRCHCTFCKGLNESFREQTGHEFPEFDVNEVAAAKQR